MYKEISLRDFKEQLKQEDTVIIDVRSPQEVAGGMIPGAININLFDPRFMEHLGALDRNKTYFMVCVSGNRSGSAAGCMVHLGFEKVYNFTDGMMSWDGEFEALLQKAINQ